MAAAKVSEKVKGALLSDWWAQRVEFAPEAQTLSADLYRDYLRTVGERNAYGRQAFARALEARGVHARKSDAGAKWRQGVRLKPTAEERAQEAFVSAIIAAPKLRVDADLKPGRVVTEDDGRYSFASMVGGDITIGIVMKTPSASDEVSAQVARELYEARRGQAREEGGKVQAYTHADDDALPPGELASMAAAMAYGASLPAIFTGWLRGRAPDAKRDLGGVHVLGIARVLWRRSFETFKAASPRAMLVKAGGLIIAAIETLDRAEARKAKLQEQGRG